MVTSITSYSNNNNNNDDDAKLKLNQWTSYTYTDGYGNTYDLQKMNYRGSDNKICTKYKWGDEEYKSWNELVKDMQESIEASKNASNSSSVTYDAQSDTFASGASGVSGYYYLNGLGITLGVDPNYRKGSLSLNLGGVTTDDGGYGYGVNVSFKF